jgi:hypothetical protein
MPRSIPSPKRLREIHPALEEPLNRLWRATAEILSNAVASAVEDALERVEGKGEEVLERVRAAKGVAKKHSRRGRRTPRPQAGEPLSKKRQRKS